MKVFQYRISYKIKILLKLEIKKQHYFTCFDVFIEKWQEEAQSGA